MNRSVRILYVDDDPLDRELVRDVLEMEHDGFEVVDAASRADFEAALAQGSFDLVLSDFNILGFEGLQVLEAVQAKDSRLPVIIVTGTGSEEVAAEAIKRGAADYVIKTPKHILRLPHIIHAVLENKRLEDEHRQAEAALRVSEARYQLIADHVGDIVWQLDVGLQFIYLSPAITDVLGYTADEGLGVHVSNFLDDEGITRMKEIIQSRLKNLDQTSKPTEYKMKHKDGHWVDVEVVSSPLFDRDGHVLGFAGITRNITERKRAEEAMRNTNILLEQTFEQSPVPMVLVSMPDATIRSANPACRRFLGIDDEPSPVGMPLQEIKPSWQDFDLQGNPSTLADLPLARSLMGQKTDGQERRIIRKDGTVVYELVSGSPIFDAAGRVIAGYLVMMDITERKQAEEVLKEYNTRLETAVEERTHELREAQEQLVRQEKLAVLGQLAGSVGHELRNPLGIINNAIYYLRLVQPDAQAKVREYLGIIEQEAHTADKIISDLLDFSRIKSVDVEPVVVSDLLRRTLERFPVPENIQVTLDLPEDLPLIYVDPRQMMQVLGNLVVNACQAMPKGGQLRVSSEQRTESSEQAVKTDPLISTHLISTHWVLITVKDTGSGITPENMKKLFEPLFTTKPKGIGLGLAVSKKLVEANGGRIEAESEPGKGSIFHVYLPVKP